LPEISDIEITIYDITGRKIETLLSERQDAGYHQVVWNAENKPSGMFLYKIQTGDYAETKKMVLLK
jgi:flagellar hook assembly protein FlgD